MPVMALSPSRGFRVIRPYEGCLQGCKQLSQLGFVLGRALLASSMRPSQAEARRCRASERPRGLVRGV